MPSNLVSSKTGIGDPYKCKTGSSHVACAADRNIHTVFFDLENLKPLLVAQFLNLIQILLQLTSNRAHAF